MLPKHKQRRRIERRVFVMARLFFYVWSSQKAQKNRKLMKIAFCAFLWLIYIRPMILPVLRSRRTIAVRWAGTETVNSVFDSRCVTRISVSREISDTNV